MVGPVNVKFDKNNKKATKVMLNFQEVLKGIEEHKDAQIIFELQAPDGGNLAGLGWTWVKLFTEAYPGQPLEFNHGRWHLPIYTRTTRPELTAEG